MESFKHLLIPGIIVATVSVLFRFEQFLLAVGDSDLSTQ
jgi:hypothetical protein